MKAVIQRVRKASVGIEGRIVGQIDRGLVVLLGVAQEDNQTDVEFLVEKLPAIRVFSDEAGKMNQSLSDVGGTLLIISQFTLLADMHRGRRPGFEKAAPPEQAEALYQLLVDRLQARQLQVETGAFGATMIVSLENDGPVTLILDTRKRKERKKEA